jgi:Ala-tRNA(Pro) deacylase
MSIANTVKRFLESHAVDYEILPHPHTSTSHETADAAFIWDDQLAKSVLLEDERGYVMAILPASHRIDLGKLRCELDRDLKFATESEIGELFSDCEVGAVPPLGPAYGIPVIYDDRLCEIGSVYFEAGNHEELIFMRGSEFLSLLEFARHGDFAASA